MQLYLGGNKQFYVYVSDTAPSCVYIQLYIRSSVRNQWPLNLYFRQLAKCNDVIMPHTSKRQLDLKCDLTRDLTWLDSTWLESPPKIEWLDLTRVTFENRLTWLDSSQNVQWLEMTRDSKVVTWSQHWSGIFFVQRAILTRYFSF